jgi:hypothetical protein
VAGTQWWIDTAGVTHVGPRLGGSVTSDFTVESFHGAPGTLSIATEDPAAWTPGTTFSSPTVAQQTIASVRHVFTEGGKSRLEVMVSGGNDRWIEDIREMIRQEVAASLPYAHTYEYVVIATDAVTIDALPVDQSRGLPPVTGLQLTAGLGALACEGSHIGIGFYDGNPGKPFLAGSAGLFSSFVTAFFDWFPSGVVGDAVALKTILLAWSVANGYVPLP